MAGFAEGLLTRDVRSLYHSSDFAAPRGIPDGFAVNMGVAQQEHSRTPVRFSSALTTVDGYTIFMAV